MDSVTESNSWKCNLSLKYGEINKMKNNQLRKRLYDLDLDKNGVTKVLQKRLKNYYKHKLFYDNNRPIPQPTLDYIAVIDYEATTEQVKGNDYPHEIIEFPIVIIDVKQARTSFEFHEYVRPILNPKLSKFCRNLTGISQQLVNNADQFIDVFQRAQEFLLKNLGSKKWAILTDGPWDMSRFLYKQCILSGVEFPNWARKWVNIRKVHSNYYNVGKPKKITLMLEDLGKKFDGCQHSGIDDTRNIARIALSLIQDGCNIRTNERLLKENQGGVGHVVGNFRNKSSTNDSNESSYESNDDDTLDSNGYALNNLHMKFNGIHITKQRRRIKEVAPDSDSEEDTDSLLLLHKLQTT